MTRIGVQQSYPALVMALVETCLCCRMGIFVSAATVSERAESSTVDASLLRTYVPRQSPTKTRPMAFFDPVDPSTESLMWPGRVGFCLVAAAATRIWLLLQVPAGPEQKWTTGTAPVAPCPLFVRGEASGLLMRSRCGKIFA